MTLRYGRVAAISAAIAVCVVGSLLVWSTAQRQQADGDGKVLDQSSSDAGSRAGPDAVSVERANVLGPQTDVELADIPYHCPDLGNPLEIRGSVLGGFTPECEAALDRRYLDRVPAAMPLTVTDGSLTWRQVFSEPLAKRAAAIDVLRRECRFHDGGASPDGVEDCDLDGLAEFGLLKYQCAGRRPHMLIRVAGGIVESVAAAGLDDVADNMVYWWRRREVEEGFYQNAWLAAKCHSLPEGALASLAPEDAPFAFRPPMPGVRPLIANVTRVGDSPEPGQEGWWWAEQAWEAKRFISWAYAL